jgi:hypothetical protein
MPDKFIAEVIQSRKKDKGNWSAKIAIAVYYGFP